MFNQYLLSNYHDEWDYHKTKRKCGGRWEEEGGDVTPIASASLLIEVSERKEENTPEAVGAHCNIGSSVFFFNIWKENQGGLFLGFSI